jgi:murein DD-endopeptidase MepM/ murein hydrolase activator NlpD
MSILVRVALPALAAAVAAALLASGGRPAPTDLKIGTLAGTSAPHPGLVGPASVVPGAVITQPFGCTSLALEPPAANCPGGHFHSGVDLAAPAGTTAYAPTAGVAWPGADPGCGVYVQLNLGGGWSALYCHLQAALVAPGERLDPGAALGLVGSTGNSTGPHVHFEVRHLGIPIDPLAWLAAPPANEST